MAGEPLSTAKMEMTLWNIHDSNGHYVGQAKAFAPETAFCRHMLVVGTQVAETEVVSEEMDDGSYRITHKSGDFILTPGP